jgi:hypothetical protein
MVGDENIRNRFEFVLLMLPNGLIAHQAGDKDKLHSGNTAKHLFELNR